MGKELNREDIRRKADIVGAIWSGHPPTEGLSVRAILAHKDARNTMGSILHMIPLFLWINPIQTMTARTTDLC